MKILETDKGTLLPLNSTNNEPYQERGGCFLAGDRRVNENTALAGMHTVWVRLHNVYARLISEKFDKHPQSFESASKTKEEKEEIIFQESRRMVIYNVFSMKNGSLHLVLCYLVTRVKSLM